MRDRWFSQMRVILCLILSLSPQMEAQVVISEFMASNGLTAQDEDGDSSDWIELYNPSNVTVDLTGWFLSNNADNLTEWPFPSTTLGPRALLTVWASGKDRSVPGAPLHANFGLNASGEFLALVHPDGVTLATVFNPYPAQYRDVSYGQGQLVTESVLLKTGADLKFRVADSPAESTQWYQNEFADTHWSTGKTGVGYQAFTPGFTAQKIDARSPVGHIDTAESVISSTSLQVRSVTEVVPVLNFLDTGGAGNYGDNAPFPGASIGADQDDFVVLATATVIIPEEGFWSFGVNSDDGFNLKIGDQSMSFPNPRAPADTVAVMQFAKAGAYPLRLVFYERGGGAGLELFAAQGRYRRFNGSKFRLVGDVTHGGLEVQTAGSAGGMNTAIQTDILRQMHEKHASFYTRIPFNVDDPGALESLTLKLKYDDGFVAFLNGVEIARDNAPGNTTWNSNATGLHGALEWEHFAITAFMPALKPGSNLLAIQVLNAASDDADVFLDASLSEYKVEEKANHYFAEATPGELNAEGSLAFVADTRFDHDRGFYSSPFDLTIATSTEFALIRYTLDGTEPTMANGLTFDRPIAINQTVTVRARAFREGYEPSDTDTQTYLFLEDVIQQAANGRAPEGWPTRWGSNTVDYGMDPAIVNHPDYRDTIIDDMQTIPSYSIVMDLDDMFGSSRGIYANPSRDGRQWERPCSVELIYPDGKDGFQINAGIRVRGGFSRSTSNPKHALRLFFRNEYGEPKLKYPVFGEDAAQSFDGFDLRTFQNYSWSFQGDSRGIFLRDQYNRDLQLAMGHHTERGEFVHLYINGMYWGLYNAVERPEASYGASYYGGDKEDYDVVKVEAGPYTINATDGNLDDWRTLYDAARAGFSSDAAYQRVLGNHPDGTRNADYPVLVDVPNLIDYMLIILYGGNLDAPISNFLGNTRPNNFYSIRNRLGDFGFQHFVHDAEHTLLNVNQDRTGPYSAGSSFQHFNPQYLWQKLLDNDAFRLKVADHIHKHMFNDGVLTREQASALFLKRKEEIDRAVVAESARWGDSKRSSPFTRDKDWMGSINKVANNFIRRRTDILFNQLKRDDLYPDLDAPALNQFGGIVQDGFQLEVDKGNADRVYFTLDGSDPRLPGGGSAPGARLYQGAITIKGHASFAARGLSHGEWSALAQTAFTVERSFNDLLVTEIMYHPSVDKAVSEEDAYEFIELKNVASNALDLSGVSFTDGIGFTFPNGFVLESGATLVLARNETEFRSRYPTVPLAGIYSGRLNNGGERLTLVHATGEVIFSFKYDDDQPWPLTPDGGGFSLVPLQTTQLQDQSQGSSWRASSQPLGSPGREDLRDGMPRVLITEILAHTDLPQLDSIELFNPGASDADIGGWYLTDDKNVPTKYVFPEGTRIPSGAYLVVTESGFNSTPGIDPSFSFSSTGESVFLFSADAQGQLSGYSHGFDFGASANGVSFGQHDTSTGQRHYPPQAQLTLGASNTGPLVGPVVINEIGYAPDGIKPEFLEMMNISNERVALFDPEFPSHTWQVEGIGFSFPTGLFMDPGEIILIANVSETQFRSAFAVPGQVRVLGPFEGNLQANGERIRLMRPDAPDIMPDGPIIPMIAVDEVRYDDKRPWPDLSFSPGASLERLDARSYGDDPINWRSSLDQSSPGVVNDGNKAPVSIAGADQALTVLSLPVIFELNGQVQDDGLPESPGHLSIQWKQVSGPGHLYFEDPHLVQTRVSAPGVGEWVVALSVSDGALTSVSQLLLSVARHAGNQDLIASGSAWKFLDNDTPQPAQWVTRNFRDDDWKSGRAQFGYGDGDEKNEISFGGNASDKTVTYYFRKAIQIRQPSSVQSMTLGLLRDDGAIVYLNGQEILRHNLPGGNVTHQTFASAVVGGDDENTFFESAIDPKLLVEGENLMAVEIHQANATSSDISFDMQLTAEWFPDNRAPELTLVSEIHSEPETWTYLEGAWSDDGLPLPRGLTEIQWEQVAGPGEVSFQNKSLLPTMARFPFVGDYLLQVHVTDGEYTSTRQLDVRVRKEGAAFSYEDWMNTFFTQKERADSSISGEDADPDADGHGNRDEFEAGTDPRASDSVTQITSVTLDDAMGLRLEISSVPGRAYILRSKANLSDSSWKLLETKLADEGELTFQIQGEQGTSMLFFQVMVVKPLN
ncbi:MAG: lamin tail domain-containing protein [Verrucomicrobiota bacterium]|nr:lamin tail domain-containing protein [Verrucomicrobiota bacterium]